ncbi:hypothetical protein QC763_110740 [Podospora pseudopauciseta]|uniref:Uncharacterized protein n=2 Tax=Podospora TaxID=5144 RepID=A0ABR0HYX7_9PEZI|nr:hypothetical protein QC763_110740 [Podospora pseudopauciseta]KAK4681809.1 hypothetical protein QC764_110740 [Podospora pseudoanserina]
MAFYLSSSLDIKMAAASGEPASGRCASPPLDKAPGPALGPRSDPTRCLSVGSTVSHGSATTEASNVRESLGSDSSAFSRQSSESYRPSRVSDIYTGNLPLNNRDSMNGMDMPYTPVTPSGSRSSSRRRGYMRPQGTDFAASARARESVLSLGSIAHLQYYFARTGLLDGKGGRLARKRDSKAQTLDLSSLDSVSFSSLKAPVSDHDSSYASMGSSPDLGAHSSFVSLAGGSLVESPTDEQHPEEFYSEDEYDEEDLNMPPPTTSTYIHREKAVPKPPTVAELRTELTNALDTAKRSLKEAKDAKAPPDDSPKISIHLTDDQGADSRARSGSTRSTRSNRSNIGWFEIQGMHILDVMTLAIRAAKIYYTSHDRPDRLDAIKSEKEIRSALLSVMEVLKRMATRGFSGGMREDEFHTMNEWISGLHSMLAAEAEIEAAEAAEREGWTWLRDEGWEGREIQREEAFIQSMLHGIKDPIENMPTIPTWVPIDRTKPLGEQTLPTPFLASLSNGQRLVHLHNCAVRKSRRRRPSYDGRCCSRPMLLASSITQARNSGLTLRMPFSNGAEQYAARLPPSWRARCHRKKNKHRQALLPAQRETWSAITTRWVRHCRCLWRTYTPAYHKIFLGRGGENWDG